MIPLRLLKKAVWDKFDKDNDFDPNLKYFRYTQSSIDNTVDENYPYTFYVFNTEDDQLVMGDNVPVAADNVLTFHMFSLGDQTSTELESLMYDLTSKLADNPTLDVEQFTNPDNWSNPTIGLMNQNITEEPETSNWHGIIRYTLTMGR